MKVSDAVAAFIANMGTYKVFGVSGGASLHLLDSIKRHPGMELICVHHEQTVAMAADAYARLTNGVGVGVVTSGPGATNLITGIAGAFYDSVPCLFITGQVSTTRMKGDLGVRQIGFQETPIVEIVKQITKSAFTVNSPNDVVPSLNRAWLAAISGRPGPVLVDIPDNIQRMEIDENSQILETKPIGAVSSFDLALVSKALLELLQESRKPIIVCGAGVRNSKNCASIVQKVQQSGIPIALTWGGKDLFPGSSAELLGTFGTHGNRKVNIAIESCDLVISIGSRLDLKSTGSPVSSFAPRAKKIMFDIDQHEINKFEKFGMKIDLPICIDISSNDFDSILEVLSSFQFQIESWKSELSELSSSLTCEPREFLDFGVNPYKFIKRLSEETPANSNIIIDTGCAIAWTMQEWQVKHGQRLIHDFNNTAMGWSIPATLASSILSDGQITICIVGDGSLMMGLNDLSTIRKSGHPVIIFLLNNGGYSMIKQTQDQWFNGDYFASASNIDLHFTNFELLAKASGYSYFRLETDTEICATFEKIFESDTSIFCEVVIQPDAKVIPIVKFGQPNHLMEPELKIVL